MNQKLCDSCRGWLEANRDEVSPFDHCHHDEQEETKFNVSAAEIMAQEMVNEIKPKTRRIEGWAKDFGDCIAFHRDKPVYRDFKKATLEIEE